MRKIITTLVALVMAGQVLAADSQWLTSLPQAAEQAKAENKAILLDFTGSDWCGWCKKLDVETLSQTEFTDYARQHLVLVRVDFPKKTALPAELQEANKALKEKYDVKGFPTLVALASDGTLLWKQTGYLKGGPQALIAKLEGKSATTALKLADPKPAAPKSADSPVVNLAALYGSAPVIRNPGDEPKLQGIFWSSSHPCVLLDGKTCEEGDSVRGMHVVKITRNQVTVKWKEQIEELSMK